MENKGENMNIYLLEKNNNQELYDYLNKRYLVVEDKDIRKAKVVIVNKVYDVRQALDIVDFALSQGIEILCIKNKFAKEHYVCNYLIKNGARHI